MTSLLLKHFLIRFLSERFSVAGSNARWVAYVALCTSVLFGVVGQLLMKWAASTPMTESSATIAILRGAFALFVYTLGVVNWIFALRAVKLSVAYPLSSINYIGILWGSAYFFGERLSPMPILGIVLIFAGVLLVALYSRTPPKPPPELFSQESKGT